jgi:dTDP-4-dehydrorhamnose 3,5-epimerase
VQINDKARRAFAVQDYSAAPTIEGVEIVQLRRFNDDGGAMTELGRLLQGKHKQLEGFEVKQVNYSTMEPGVTKAYHMHHRQTDVWFVPPHDKMLLVLHDARQGSKTEGVTMRRVLGDGNSQLVRIPPGVAHGVRNISTSTARILYFVDVQFSPEKNECDEGRLPWDFLGADVWEIQRG